MLSSGVPKRKALLLLALACCAHPTALLAEPAPKVALAWELLSPELRQAAALAEARLAEAEGMRLLEREQVGAVLREHAAALRQTSPETSGLALGRLLGADVLVRVREEERADTSSAAPVLLGLRVEAFEVGSTLALVDTTIPVPPNAPVPVASVCEGLVRLVQSAAARWPSSDKGLVRVAVLPPVVRSWDRGLFEQGVGATRILSQRLGQSADLALLAREGMAAATMERMLADAPAPATADRGVALALARGPDGMLVVAVEVWDGARAHRLPDHHVDSLDLAVLETLSSEALAALAPTAAASPKARAELESELLFVRAYDLARSGFFTESYELAQASWLLDPKRGNARRLALRVYPHLLVNVLERTAGLDDEVRQRVSNECGEYIADYHRRFREWYEQTPSHLMVSQEFMQLGDLNDGYSLGAETFCFGNDVLKAWPELAAQRERERLECAVVYQKRMEALGDPRLLHRPRNAVGDFGPPNLTVHLAGQTDDARFFDTARRYLAYETGTFPWSHPGASAVRGYSALCREVPAIVVRRAQQGRAAPAAVAEFVRWLGGQTDPLAALWRHEIATGLRATQPELAAFAVPRPELARAVVQIADRLNADGSTDRCHTERRKFLFDLRTQLWSGCDADALLACWRSATGIRADTRVALALVLANVLSEAATPEPGNPGAVVSIAEEALRQLRPGENGADWLQAMRGIALEKLGQPRHARTVAVAAECVFEHVTADRSLPRAWGNHCEAEGTVFLYNRLDESVHAVRLSDGAMRVYPLAAAGAGARPRRPSQPCVHPGVEQERGTVCAGSLWYPSPKGLLRIGLADGEVQVVGTAQGLYAEDVRCVASVQGRIYGVCVGGGSNAWNSHKYGDDGALALFEYDPSTGCARDLEGTLLPGSRWHGQTDLKVPVLLGDETRRGLWSGEMVWGGVWPHFYSLGSREWVRLRINAFDWRMKDCSVGMESHPRGVQFAGFLYDADADAMSYLPTSYLGGVPAAGALGVDINPPMAEWRGSLWGADASGRLCRLNPVERTVEQVEGLAGAGRLHMLFPSGEFLGVLYADRGARQIQLWRVRATSSKPIPRAGGVRVPSVSGGDGAPALRQQDAAACALPGLRSVPQPVWPPLEPLADGSAAAQRRQQEFVRRSGLPAEVVNTVGMRFRLIPPGRFTMGDRASSSYFALWRASERDVEISEAIYVGVHEVTQSEWRRVMASVPLLLGPRGGDLPMEEVSREMAQDFLKRLCQLEGVPLGTYRMPSEAEWEYACRAGTRTMTCYGDMPREGLADVESVFGIYPYCLSYRADRPVVLPVGSHPPNAWGLADMHGSVAEWCQDLYVWDYGSTPTRDPVQAECGWRRVYRGGARDSPWLDASSYFVEFAPVPSNVRARGIGLRVARTPVPPAPK
jgi:formylglycine-generating enzyme required for sulfatase activity